MDTNINHFYKFFNSMYEEFQHQYYNYVKAQNNKIKIEQVTELTIEDASKYLPSLLVNKINKLKYVQYTLNDKFMNVDINLRVYHEVSFNIKKMNMYIIFVTYFIIFVASKINSLHGVTTIMLKVVCSPFKKRMNNAKTLTAYNVNGGITTMYYNMPVREVLVFREEEVIKVLIHELLHALGMDVKNIDAKSEKPLSTFFNVENVNCNESFNDTFACLLNVFLVTKFMKGKYSLFSYLLECETAFIIKQSNKILPILGIDVIDKRLSKTNDIPRKEATHVISYYILKSLNFANMNDFISILKMNNYKFSSSIVKIYIDHLTKIIKLNELPLFTKTLNLKQSKSIALQKMNKYMWKVYNDNGTLRMSCVDVSAI